MSSIKEVFKDLWHYAPAKLIPSLFNFVALSSFTRLLSPAEYGNYILVVTSTTIISAFSIAWISQANIRLYEKYNSIEYREQYISTNVLIFFIVNIIVTLLWLLFLIIFPKLFNPQLLYFLKIGSLYLFFENGFTFSTGFLRAQRKSKLFMQQNLIKTVFGVLLSLFFIYYFSFGPEIILIVSATFSGLFFILVLSELNNKWKIQKQKFSMSIFINSVKYGVPLSLTALASYVLTLSDRYIIKMYFGSEQVGIYSAGYRLAEMSIFLLSGILVFAAFPIIVSTYEKEGKEITQLLIKKLSSIYIVTTAPILLIMFVLSNDFVQLFFSKSFNEAHKIIPYISLGAFLYGLAQYINKAFELTEKTKYLFYLLLISSLLTITSNLILIPKYGYMGAAFSVLLGYLLYTFFSYIFSFKNFKWLIPWETIWKVLISLLGSFVIYNFIHVRNYNLIFRVIINFTLILTTYILGIILLREPTVINYVYNYNGIFRKK